ncbi:putative SPBc2 prophage-derived protein YoqJ, partial [Dysosmobacter welbionis]
REAFFMASRSAQGAIRYGKTSNPTGRPAGRLPAPRPRGPQQAGDFSPVPWCPCRSVPPGGPLAVPASSILSGPVRLPVEPVLDRHRNPPRRHHRPPAGDRPRHGHCHRRDCGDRRRLSALPGGDPGGHRQGQGQAPPHPGQQCDGGFRRQGTGPLHRGGQRPHCRGRRGPQRGAGGLHRRGRPRPCGPSGRK